MPLLSIITPSYNRAHLLPACYQSLCAQTDKDFEWIIVDDGSTDNTEQVVQSFVGSDFFVIYVKKENGGKHTALNAAHPHVHGKYVLQFDSDDTLTADAVAQVRAAWGHWDSCPEVGMVTFLKGEAIDRPDCIVEDFDTPVDILRYQRTILYAPECCEVLRAELFLKYPFPEYEGERYISECALWNRVAITHKCVYINRVIYLFEYQEGGLTKSGRKLRITNPKGGMFICDLRMRKKNYLKQRIKYGMLYCCYGFFAGLSVAKIMRDTKYKLLTAVCLFPGYGIYLYWNKKFGE